MASSSLHSGPSISNSSSSVEKDLNHYLPLYKAAIKGDWDTARRFLDFNPDAITTYITKISETVLHIAVGRSEAIAFVNKLVELIPVKALSMTNKFSETSLHYAAKYGNIEAARLLVSRDPGLPHIWSDSRLLPLHLAALFGHKEMVLYLLTVTGDNVEPSPYTDQPGLTLINAVIYSGFYDVALNLLRHNPKLATTISPGNNTPLSIIGGRPFAFPSGARLSFSQQLIYSWVPVSMEDIPSHSSRQDIENVSEQHICSQLAISIFRKEHFVSASQKVYGKFWKVIAGIVPYVKRVCDTKLMHHQAIELVKTLCVEVANVENLKSGFIYKPAIILGATLGIHEVVEEILKSFPSAIWSLDREHHDLFQLAVINRRATIFSLLYEMDYHTRLVTQNIDKYENNILHLAGKLAPPHRLNLVTGAALQMQRELQWYKEVEKFVLPNYKAKKNSDGKTPAMVFTKEHKNLIADGEQWLKDTANSCTIVAALIATVVFAAAITVPGGSNGDSGFPIFHKEKSFIIFGISNAISLFSSTTSLLMFLFILTSRCAEADFLYSLPNKLIIGLVHLFLSITSMMIAFGAAMYIVFGQQRSWIIIPVTALACLPVTLFVSLQYPLLKDMIKSTYGPGIFGKQRKYPF